MVSGFVRGGRRLTRLLALAWVIFSSLLAFAFVAAHRRDPAARARWLQGGCRRGLRALKVRTRTSGITPVSAVIVANHLGYLDVLVLSSLTPAAFVAKRELRSWPVFGWLSLMGGTRFIDRGKRSDVARLAAELHGSLAPGVSLVMFLEGTSTGGETVLPFKSSLLDPAVRLGWAVTPVALAYEVPAGHSAAAEVCWWGDMTFMPHLLNLLALPEIVGHVAWGPPLPAATDRKELAIALHARVIELHSGLKGATAGGSSVPAKSSA